MNISRRDLLLSGSAASTLWLTGCGGGGSADGAPKPSTGTGNTSGSCAVRVSEGVDTPANSTGYFLAFSNTTAFQSPNTKMVVDMALINDFVFGCTNQITTGSEGPFQELFVSFIQYLPMATTGYSTDLVRNLRLHLSIPHDMSGETIFPGDTFNVGDPTNPGGCYVFSGTMIVSAPAAADGANSWAYEITSGTVQILDQLNLFGLGGVKLNNVVATAAAAGNGNNAAFSAGGQLQMNGLMPVVFEALTTVL